MRLTSSFTPSSLPCCVLPSTHLVLMLYSIPIPTFLCAFFKLFIVVYISDGRGSGRDGKKECTSVGFTVTTG